MVVGAVGTTVTGMIVGEILIPIPIVGALVGGVIGGYFGEKGSRSFKSILSNKQLISLISYLKGSVIENKCWKYSEEMLGKLGVSKKYFESTISTNS
jgi:phage tail tape-measure protein